MATFATRYKTACIASLAVALSTTSVQEAKCGQGLGSYSGPRSVVVFAARKITKGARIAEDDLSETVINSQGLKEADIPTRKSVVARRARYEIAKGQIIFEQELILNRLKPGRSTKRRKYLATFVEAKNNISEGATITRSDLLLNSVRTFDSSKWLSRIDQAVGMRARRAIISRQLLTTDLLMLDSTLPQIH